jgi:hypothetical protein
MANSLRKVMVRAMASGLAVGVARVATVFFVAAFTGFSWAASCFDDKDVSTAAAQQPRGALLYVWSPRMVLSAQHAASAQRQAMQHGLRFVPVHDAGVPAAELAASLGRLLGPSDDPLHHAGKNNTKTNTDHSAINTNHSHSVLATSQPLCAPSLLERDALRHFPTAFVVKASGVHRHAIIGAMPEAAWASSIAQRLVWGQPLPAEAERQR